MKHKNNQSSLILILTIIPALLLLLAPIGLLPTIWAGCFLICTLALVGVAVYSKKTLGAGRLAGSVAAYIVSVILVGDFFGEVFCSSQSIKSFCQNFLLNGQSLYIYYALVPVLMGLGAYLLLKNKK